MKTSIKITVLVCLLIITACSKEKTITKTADNSTKDNVALITLEDKTEEKRSVVFITGYDKGTNTFYADAKNYFTDLEVEIVETAYSVQEIILWLNINYNDVSFNDIHIVSDNKWK